MREVHYIKSYEDGELTIDTDILNDYQVSFLLYHKDMYKKLSLTEKQRYNEWKERMGIKEYILPDIKKEDK